MADTDQLLAHLEPYGVVVCKSCQFAVQPSALPSHLLRHRIYRNERRQLLQRLSKLTLLEPEDVPLPSNNSDPLPNLSVHRGFKCQSPGCDHACVSSKRMSQHWSEQHDEHDSRNVKARSAYLQTFFRGNKIRYFEVNGSGGASVHAGGSKAQADEISTASNASLSPPATRDRKESVATAASSESRTPEDNTMLEEPSILNLDMQAMQYFHHYILNTSLTCRRSESESEYFWKVVIPQQGFQHPFLMFSVLGLAALHQAVLSLDTPSICNVHREAAIQYQNSALVDFRSAVRLPDPNNSTALIAFGRFFGVQRCVQHQIEWIFHIPPSLSTGGPVGGIGIGGGGGGGGSSIISTNGGGTTHLPDDGSAADDKDMSKLLEFFFLLRGEHEMLMTLQHLLPRGSDLILSEESMSGLTSLQAGKPITPDLLADIPPNIVERLLRLPSKLMPLVARQDSPEALPEHHEPAVNSLLMAFALSYASPPDMRNLWDGAEGWVRILPDQYIHMLSAAQPGALVIFAHWCLLAQRLEEHYWFVNGQTMRLLNIVMNNLPDDEWRSLVADLL